MPLPAQAVLGSRWTSLEREVEHNQLEKKQLRLFALAFWMFLNILGNGFGGRGRTRINIQMQFQQHAGQRMTLKTVQSSLSAVNRAQIERAFATRVP